LIDVSVLIIFLPKNEQRAQVKTEIATVLIAETPWMKKATKSGANSISA
jgi:hypothetical protein